MRTGRYTRADNQQASLSSVSFLTLIQIGYIWRDSRALPAQV